MQSISQPTAETLLAWYDRHGRVLPWRISPSRMRAGEAADPYKVWLSEIMLQQTTVQAVKAYFTAFTQRWPTLSDLAHAPTDDIMKMWAGLGYYSRARNLQACAQAVVAHFGGHFPNDEETLRSLPGIGPYTAAAISAIAFGQRAVVVDGNVERVMTRLHAIDALMPAAKPLVRVRMDEITPQARAGDFAQAVMDLGATICIPRHPRCGVCPFLGACAAQKAGTAELYPVKAPKTPKVMRQGAAFVAVRPDGATLCRTRPPKGLLGGMTEVPGTAWAAQSSPADWLAQAPLRATWERLPAPVRHVFTHFPLELTVFRAAVPLHVPAPAGCRWVPAPDLAGEAFPTLFRKVLEMALAQ
jgi:A/G-specific adenine glycosylase